MDKYYYIHVILEYFSLFVIESLALHMDIYNYTAQQRSLHCMIMFFLWIIVTGIILWYSKVHYGFPAGSGGNKKISLGNKIVTLICLAGCKVITFIDWHTLKVIGELRGKSAFQFYEQLHAFRKDDRIQKIISQTGKSCPSPKAFITEIPIPSFSHRR